MPNGKNKPNKSKSYRHNFHMAREKSSTKKKKMTSRKKGRYRERKERKKKKKRQLKKNNHTKMENKCIETVEHIDFLPYLIRAYNFQNCTSYHYAEIEKSPFFFLRIFLQIGFPHQANRSDISITYCRHTS